MRRAAILLLFAATGCAGQNAYVNTYRAGVIAKQVVTESHKELWSDPLRDKVQECDTEENSTTELLDECLKPFTKDNNEKVVQTLAAYQAAAATLSTILIASEKDPNGVNKEALKQAIGDTLAAARELIALFPEGQAWLDRLDMLLKGLL